MNINAVCKQTVRLDFYGNKKLKKSPLFHYSKISLQEGYHQISSVGWLFGFYDLCIGYLMPNPFLYK